jgi:hypothetical protein
MSGHAPAALPLGKSPRYPLGRRLGGPQSQSERRGEFLTLPRLELRPLGRPARSQSLYRLRYPGSPPDTVRMIKLKKRCAEHVERERKMRYANKFWLESLGNEDLIRENKA